MAEDNTSPASSTEDLIPETELLSSNESVGSADSPKLSRSSSFASTAQWLNDDWEFTPLDKLTVFDVLDNLALPQRLEKINKSLNLKKHRDKVKAQYEKQKERVKKRTDEELEKFKTKYTKGLDDLIVQWNDTRVSEYGPSLHFHAILTSATQAISAREKISFVVGVSNIFITGFLLGGYP